MSDTNTPNDPLDQATSQRLARLRGMPVDSSRLDKLIQARIPRSRPSWARRTLLLRPVRAVAASVAVLAIIGVIIWSLSGGAVLASPSTMAQFHEDLVSGKVSSIQVDSIAEANRHLAEQWNQSVQIPQVPMEHAMLCCMRSIKDKRVACVLLKSEGGIPVTMAVANAMDMKLPNSQTLTFGGITYHVQSSGQLNMVMTERSGRWICLIGALPTERLANIASAIKF